MKSTIIISILVAALAGTAWAGDTESWDFSADPFSTGGGWHKVDKPGRWIPGNVSWDQANECVNLKVVDGFGSAMFTSQSFKPGVFDFNAKIITQAGIASCFWTYLQTQTYYSEIDLEISAAPSHQAYGDQEPGELVDANDVCPSYATAGTGSRSTNVIRYTSYNNKDVGDHLTTVWQNVQRPSIDLTEDKFRTYRIAWYSTGDTHSDRVEYWIGDGDAKNETMTLVFALYADKVRFYDNRIKPSSGNVETDYYMERRSINSHGDYTPEQIDGQTRQPGKAYLWNGTSYDESDATEFQNYQGTMKPCIPPAESIAPIYIGPWCPHWSDGGDPPAGTYTMVINSVKYTPNASSNGCDINQDGVVDAQDLDAVRACLGLCSGDTDASGNVDVLDLLQVIEDWGECSPAP